MKTMRNILLAILLMAPALTVAQDAAQADALYQAGDFQAAIEQYEQLLSSGLTSAELHYNLAGAYYREGQMGRAILNYERALRLDPTMTDARQNLAIAESQTPDRINAVPKLFVVQWADSLTTHVRPATWRWVLVALLALAGAALVLLRLGRSRNLRKTGLIVLLIDVPFVVLAVLLAVGSSTRFNARSQAIVMSQAAIVKSSPEEQSVDKMILHEGTHVTLHDSLSAWYKITIADGTSGWCSKADVERI